MRKKTILGREPGEFWGNGVAIARSRECGSAVESAAADIMLRKFLRVDRFGIMASRVE